MWEFLITLIARLTPINIILCAIVSALSWIIWKLFNMYIAARDEHTNFVINAHDTDHAFMSEMKNTIETLIKVMNSSKKDGGSNV